MSNLSISIVLHNNEIKMIDEVIHSCASSNIKPEIFVVDNSSDSRFSYLVRDERITYYRTNDNCGFGGGHNIGIKKYDILAKFDYHLVLNPDVSFNQEVLTELINYLDANLDVGAIMPRITNFDGSLQFARRLLPAPIDIIMKRLCPMSAVARRYEIKDMEPQSPVEIGGLCGCFMLMRCSELIKSGLFDERYFMYFEDFDLARRISMSSKVIYFPGVSARHGANREHKRSFRISFYLISSAIKYYIKWGYYDAERLKINAKAIKQIEDSIV
jgi:GT2 family glycosyltransferase